MTGIVLFASALLLSIFFASIFREKRQMYLRLWSLAWLLVAVHYLALMVSSSSTSLAAVG